MLTFSRSFHPGGCINSVTKQSVPRHGSSYHTSHAWSCKTYNTSKVVSILKLPVVNYAQFVNRKITNNLDGIASFFVFQIMIHVCNPTKNNIRYLVSMHFQFTCKLHNQYTSVSPLLERLFSRFNLCFT